MSKEPTERHLSIQREGKLASHVLASTRTILDEQASDCIASLKMLYRSGEYTETKLAAKVAELCAIDDLISRLEGRVNAGNHVTKELQK